MRHLQTAWMRLPPTFRFGLAVVCAFLTVLGLPTLADGIAGWGVWLGFVGSTAASYAFPTLGLLGLATIGGLQFAEHRARNHMGRASTDRPPLARGQALDHWDQRRLLARALRTAYRDCLRWVGRDLDAEFERWQERTCDLILSALGEPAAARFLSEWERGEQTLTGLDARLMHLHDLISRVDSVGSLVLCPDFDGEEWVSKR